MLSGARVVGQAFDKFVIADAGGCIICIDQHAADERVR
jgi:DNA mismatch repair ATPase MutL